MEQKRCRFLWKGGSVMLSTLRPVCLGTLCLLALVAPSGPATLQIDAAHPGPRVSPMLYGLMTEEINHAYDGGLYAELVRNRAFQDDVSAPVHWSVVQDGGGTGSIALDNSQPLSAALPASLK